MSKVAIDSQVVIQEQGAEIDWLRNRLLLQGQAIADLKAKCADLERDLKDLAEPKLGIDND